MLHTRLQAISPSYLPSDNSSIEPSDQPSTVVKKGMYQLPVPLLVGEYPIAILWFQNQVIFVHGF